MTSRRAVTSSTAVATSAGPVSDPRTAEGARGPSRALRIGLGVPAALLVAAAWKLPVWQARLSAPQYPKGLRLTASGSGVVGDIAEVNELNHYVGMKAFSTADAPEMRLWAPVILIALVAVIVATALPSRNWGARLIPLGIALIPVGALLDVQYRLYQYGHSVQADAAIRIDPFTPLVVGNTTVLNFTTFAYPGEALWCLLGAAFLLALGPWTVRRIRTWVAAHADTVTRPAAG